MLNKLTLGVIILFGILSNTQAQDFGLSCDNIVNEPGGYWHAEDEIISIYTDSLNFWQPGAGLPSFVFNPILDLEKQNIFLSCKHSGKKNDWLNSLRYEIFKRVYNRAVLHLLISMPDDRLDNLYNPTDCQQLKYDSENPGPPVLWMNLSTRELAMRRLYELNKLTKTNSKE